MLYLIYYKFIFTRMNKNTFLLIVLLILVLGGGYWYMKSKNIVRMMPAVEQDAASTQIDK